VQVGAGDDVKTLHGRVLVRVKQVVVESQVREMGRDGKIHQYIMSRSNINLKTLLQRITP
jgi:hypothetical protein